MKNARNAAMNIAFPVRTHCPVDGVLTMARAEGFCRCQRKQAATSFLATDAFIITKLRTNQQLIVWILKKVRSPQTPMNRIIRLVSDFGALAFLTTKALAARASR